MSGGIFLLRGEDDLVEMTETPYDSEEVLQSLLAKYPSLLAGDQLRTAEPRRWLLIAREASLPAAEDGGGRWSVDHLFLDQDAVPTLVEVKRSSDTRIRREVVGQMLDYAANAVVYWPTERLRAGFEARCQRDGLAGDELVRALLDDEEISPDEFWQRTDTNLKAGRVRLAFVADEIPPELRRVIEFLNEQMSPAEVLGIEVRQYVGADSLRTLVPRVIGRTAEAEQRKGRTSGPGEVWSWERYRQVIGEERFAIVEALRQAIMGAMRELGLGWTEVPQLRNGYIGYQRSGGYNVIVIVTRRGGVQITVKLPDSPLNMGVENPYPTLSQTWDERRREWIWTIPSLGQLPDVRAAMKLTARYQPVSGPMTHRP